MDTLGEKLRQYRLELNLTIDDISEKTKIRKQYLTAIEDNNFEVLPNVYLRSFIKSYANVLKIETDEINKLLDETFKTKEVKKSQINKILQSDSISETKEYKSVLSKKVSTKKQSNVLINYFIYSGLILASAALLYFSLFTESSHTDEDDVSLGADKGSDTAVIKDNESDILNFFQQSDSLTLEARALDTAWLRIDVDGKKSDVVLMTPGMVKKWAAKEFFLINLGNAGAVQFSRNGDNLPLFGSKGTVIRNLKITKTTIESSSTPWNESAQKKKTETDTKPKMPPTIEPSKIKPTKIDNQNNDSL